MSPIVLPTPQSSDEWHAMRANGIGASEIAAVLGLHPWTCVTRCACGAWRHYTAGDVCDVCARLDTQRQEAS